MRRRYVPEAGNRWLPAVFLTLLAGVTAALITQTQQSTRERIRDNETEQMLRGLAEVLPDHGYDNKPHLDRIMADDPELLGSDEPQPIYRARKAGQPAAAALTVTAPGGYVGPIRLLVGIDLAGRVTGVRVIAHRETPGLGDRIDTKKSDWLSRFNGRSDTHPPAERWRVRRDGGDFDQITGATITSRAVVSAVHNAVRYFAKHREEIFNGQ